MYPKWKYHPSNKPRLVSDERQERDLGKEWFNNPNFKLEPDDEVFWAWANKTVGGRPKGSAEVKSDG